MNDKIKNLQDIDPLKIAEDLLGTSYKESVVTGMLGLALQMKKNELLNKLLTESDETKFGDTIEEYIRKVKEFGFEEVYQEFFDNDGVEESYYIFWHPDFSILLSFDSHWGKINGGNYYYNWSPDDKKDKSTFQLTGSGGWRGQYWKPDFSGELPFEEEEPMFGFNGTSYEDYLELLKSWSLRRDEHIAENNLRALFIGSGDCREALRNSIGMMVEKGEFLTKWKDTPFLWLIHYGDNKGIEGKEKFDNYKVLNKMRFDRLPEYVKTAMGTHESNGG